jgi:hypothetical protein
MLRLRVRQTCWFLMPLVVAAIATGCSKKSNSGTEGASATASSPVQPAASGPVAITGPAATSAPQGGPSVTIPKGNLVYHARLGVDVFECLEFKS